jgi:hypothetical protein
MKFAKAKGSALQENMCKVLIFLLANEASSTITNREYQHPSKKTTKNVKYISNQTYARQLGQLK